MYEECKNIFSMFGKLVQILNRKQRRDGDHPVFSAYDRVVVRDAGGRRDRSVYYHHA